jgi:hypothetical protein
MEDQDRGNGRDNGRDNGREGDVRARIVDMLLEKIANDTYPSLPMMVLLEQLMTPEETPAYAAVLMEKVSEARYPSVSMMAHLVEVAQSV